MSMKNKQFSGGRMPTHNDDEAHPGHINEASNDAGNDESRPGHINAKCDSVVDSTRPGGINKRGDNFGRKGGSNSAK